MENRPKLIYSYSSRAARQMMYFHIARQAFRLYQYPTGVIEGLIKLLHFQNSVNGTPKVTKFIRKDNLYYWTPEYPGFPSIRFNTLINSEFQVNGRRVKPMILPRPVLKTVVWAITNRCPLSCSHCYEWENINTSDRLVLGDLQKILSIFRMNHIQHVQFSGGEPLFRFNDLLELIREASVTMDCWLLTSGFGMTAARAVTLREEGLTGVHISLDHWDAIRNNRFRNHESSFQRAVQAVSDSLNAGLMVSLSLCATRDFATEENLMEYAKMAKDLGVHFIRILEPRAAGKFADQQVHLDLRQIKLISDFTIRMNSERSFRDFPIIEFLGYHQLKMDCFGAGNRFLYVDPNGDVHACPFCRGKTGNLLTESLETILLRTRTAGCQFRKLSAG